MIGCSICGNPLELNEHHLRVESCECCLHKGCFFEKMFYQIQLDHWTCPICGIKPIIGYEYTPIDATDSILELLPKKDGSIEVLSLDGVQSNPSYGKEMIEDVESISIINESNEMNDGRTVDSCDSTSQSNPGNSNNCSQNILSPNSKPMNPISALSQLVSCRANSENTITQPQILTIEPKAPEPKPDLPVWVDTGEDVIDVEDDFGYTDDFVSSDTRMNVEPSENEVELDQSSRLLQQPLIGDAMVPLRFKKSATTQNQRKHLDAESPEKWRNRIWPAKAVTAFCRILTRCIPPPSSIGVKLNRSSGKLTAHWKERELLSVGLEFDSIAKHSSTFFLLTVEECREAVTNFDEFELFEKQTDLLSQPLPRPSAGPRFVGYSKVRQGDVKLSGGKNGWVELEITGIIAESEMGSLPKQVNDPRLGSVWVVSVEMLRPNPNRNHANAQEEGLNGISSVSEVEYAGGDLVLMRSHQWQTPVLGIVQPWDPDYDIKYGINFAVNQSSGMVNAKGSNSRRSFISSNSANKGKTSEPGEELYAYAFNLLVCVDHAFKGGVPPIQGSNPAGGQKGGWAAPGDIVVGSRFCMTCIGNVMTSIRECQALLSLRHIDSRLQDLILHPSKYSTDESRSRFFNSNCGENVGKGREDQGFSSFGVVACPTNIPVLLWRCLEELYNESQLRAIRSVCVPNTAVRGPQGLDGSNGNGEGTENSKTTPAALTLLQGPPGTGKTRTILGLLAVLLAGALNWSGSNHTKVVAGAALATKNNANGDSSIPNELGSGRKIRILVCAPSNTAVDELVYRIVTQGVLGGDGKRLDDLFVIRIGHNPHREESQKSQPNQRKRHIPQQENDIQRVVERVSLETLVEEKRASLAGSFGSLNTGGKGGSLKTVDIRKQVLEKADIVCCTLSGSGSQPILEVVLLINNFQFDAIIIDEAAQAVEPSSLIPFKYNPQVVVMLGDPCQLPSTVFSKAAKNAKYDQSLFERLQLAGYPVTMLETQYRMHPDIARFPSERYYSQRLRTAEELIAKGSHEKPYHLDTSLKYRPFVFHNVNGKEANQGTSVYNQEEAKYVLNLFEGLIQQYPEHCQDIGIIAPYRAQRRLITKLFKERYGQRFSILDGEYRGRKNVYAEISTIDCFQGREKNIIIFSCVRASNPEAKRQQLKRNLATNSKGFVDLAVLEEARKGGGIGFLKEGTRLNVALTRAKYACWIVGNVLTLEKDEEWAQLIDYSKNNNYLLLGESLNTSKKNKNKSKNDKKQRNDYNDRDQSNSFNDINQSNNYYDGNRNRNYYQNDRNCHRFYDSNEGQNDKYSSKKRVYRDIEGEQENGSRNGFKKKKKWNKWSREDNEDKVNVGNSSKLENTKSENS